MHFQGKDQTGKNGRKRAKGTLMFLHPSLTQSPFCKKGRRKMWMTSVGTFLPQGRPDRQTGEGVGVSSPSSLSLSGSPEQGRRRGRVQNQTESKGRERRMNGRGRKKQSFHLCARAFYDHYPNPLPLRMATVLLQHVRSRVPSLQTHETRGWFWRMKGRG